MARAGMANLIIRLRSLVGDSWQLHQDSATGDGSTDTFWLNYKPEASGGTVSVGGTAQGTAAYTWDVANGRVEFGTAPANNAAVAIEYLASQFTDADLQDILDGNCMVVESQEMRWLPDTIAGGTSVWHRAAIGWRDLEEAESGTIYWTVKDGTGAIQGTADYTKDYIAGQVRFTADRYGTAYYWTGRSYDLYGAAADVWLRRQAIYSEWFDFKSDDQSFTRAKAFDHAVVMEKQMRGRAGQNRERGAVRSNAFRRTDLNRTVT